MPKQKAIFATSNSKVGANKRIMLVIPTILTTIPLVPEMYLAAFSFMVKPWASAYFFISKVMAVPVSTIIRP